MNDENLIRRDRMRFIKNSQSANLCYLAILLNVFYFVSIYKSDVGTYYYNILIGVSIVYNLIFMLAAKWVPAWIPVILFAVLLGVAAVGFISADAMRDEVERQDVVHKADVGTMRALQSKAVFVASQCEDADTKKALNAFAEALRFSDPVSSAATADIEENLTGLVEELGSAVLDKDFTAAQALCTKASTLLADRNRMCKLNK